MPSAPAARRVVRAGVSRAAAAPRLVWVGLLLVLVQLVVRGWALAGSWFYFDDLAFMSRAMNQPMDPSYLFESYGGHLMPAGFAVVWVLTRIAVYDWWVWAAVLLVMQAVAGVGMLRLLRSMFGDTRVVLLLLAGYLSLVFTLSAGIWFAAGINQLPLQIALVFGLHSHLAYLRTRRWQHLVASVAWTLFGLVFYEKTLLLLGVYALVTICWFSTGNTPERLRTVWERYRPAVLAYVVLGGAYTAAYGVVGLNFSPTTANNQPLTPVAFNLVARAGSTGLIGGPLGWRPLEVGSFGDPSQLLMVVSWVVVGAVVYYASLTRTVSKRAWSLVGFTLVANVVLLASARANIVGPDIALEYRYQTETSALFVLALGLAFLPLRGALVVNEVTDTVPRTYETRPVLLGVTGLIVVAALVSTTRYVDLWQSRNPTEAYYAQVTSSLAAATKKSGKPVALVDGSIPQTMLWAYRYPENAYSHVFRNLAAETSYPTAAIDSLSILDDRGRLTPVVVPGTRTLLSGSGTCAAASATRPRSTVLTLNGPVVGGGWWVRMSYYAKTAQTVRIRAGEETHTSRLPSGLHNVFFTAAGKFSKISVVRRSGDADLCVSDLALGIPGTAGGTA